MRPTIVVERYRRKPAWARELQFALAFVALLLALPSCQSAVAPTFAPVPAISVDPGEIRVEPHAAWCPECVGLPDLGTEPRQGWLPATEIFGERIFLRFSPSGLAAWESSDADALSQRLARIEERIKSPGRPASRFLHLADKLGRFLMVHTFTHLLIRQLCYNCKAHTLPEMPPASGCYPMRFVSGLRVKVRAATFS